MTTDTDRHPPGVPATDRPRTAEVAAVILAFQDPPQLKRLVTALGDIDIFVHCDVRTPPDVFADMQRGMPDRVRWLARRPTPWASWGQFEASLDGMRRTLAETSASHVAMVTGTDYPLSTSKALHRVIADRVGDRSVLPYRILPYEQWGRSGGMDRFRYRHRPWRKRMLRLPIPRRIPDGLTPAGSSSSVLLCRRHVETVVSVEQRRPDVQRFFRTVWSPEETFTATVLASPELGGNPSELICQSLWFINWTKGRKSPPFLTSEDFPAVSAAAARDRHDPTQLPALFARKFNTHQSAELLDRIDVELIGAPAI